MRRFKLHSPSAHTGRAISVAILATLLAIGLAGCQQLFTTSLGAALARTSIPIPANLSPSQAADLAAQAKANEDTKLARALVDSLVAQIAATTDPATKQALQASAASAAIVASGVGSTLLSLFSDTSNVDPAALLASLQASGSANIIAALSYLDPATGIGSPSASGLGATDYAIAALVIAASAIPPNTDMNTFDPASLGTPGVDAAATTFDLAKTVMGQADSLSASDPTSQSLLDQIMGQLSM